MRSSSYWDKRANRRLTEAEKLSQSHIDNIKKIYNKAYRNINKELANIYKNYSNETGLDIQTLRTLLSKKETDKFWQTLEGKGLKQYVKNNYKSRISRLEQIQAQLYAKCKEIAPNEVKENTKVYHGVVNNSYNRAIYDTQIGTGYDFAFNKLDDNTVNAILNERWSNKNYSERIWTNTDILGNKISHIIGGALLSGQNQTKTANEIMQAFKVSKYYAERLVRTETNHFNNEAEALAYDELGLERYVFVATLDGRTSETCQNHDNEIFYFKDKEVGVNYPPLHPNCRSTVRAYIGDEEEKELKRKARNPITGKVETIDNISYKDWIKQYTDPLDEPEVKPIDDKIKSLTKNQKDAVELYVSGDGMWINQYLRGRGDFGELSDSEKAYLKDLRAGTNNKLGEPMTLYRSVDASSIFGNISDTDYENLVNRIVYNDNQKIILNSTDKYLDDIIGKEFSEKGFMSTSTSLDLTKDFGGFTGSDKPIILELETPKNIKGINLSKDIPDLEEIMQQKEVLLQDGVNYKITGIEGKDGNIYVKAKIMGQNTKTAEKLIKEPKNDIIKIASNNLPQQFREKKESVSTDKLIDYINNCKNANPKVVEIYKNFGRYVDKVPEAEKMFKISHAKDSRAGGGWNLYSQKYVNCTICIPNLKDMENITGGVHTTLHEMGHYLDMLARPDKNSIKWLNEYIDNFDDILDKYDNSISDDILNLFKNSDKECKEIAKKQVEIFKDEIAKLRETYKEALANPYANIKAYNTYVKESKALIKESQKLQDYAQRNYMNGVGNLEDIYDALSGGAFRDRGTVLYGHGRKYYAYKSDRKAEIIANYLDLSITRPDLIDMLKKDKPELTKVLDKFIDKLYDEIVKG